MPQQRPQRLGLAERGQGDRGGGLTARRARPWRPRRRDRRHARRAPCEARRAPAQSDPSLHQLPQQNARRLGRRVRRQRASFAGCPRVASMSATASAAVDWLAPSRLGSRQISRKCGSSNRGKRGPAARSTATACRGCSAISASARAAAKAPIESAETPARAWPARRRREAGRPARPIRRAARGAGSSTPASSGCSAQGVADQPRKRRARRPEAAHDRQSARPASADRGRARAWRPRGPASEVVVVLLEALQSRPQIGAMCMQVGERSRQARDSRPAGPSRARWCARSRLRSGHDRVVPAATIDERGRRADDEMPRRLLSSSAARRWSRSARRVNAEDLEPFQQRGQPAQTPAGRTRAR